MADFSVQFYVYRNQNIRGIILDKIYNYHTVLVEAYNMALFYSFLSYTGDSSRSTFHYHPRLRLG